MRSVELGDEGVEGLLPADPAGGADGRAGEFRIGRRDGGDDRPGLRGGVAGSEPTDNVGFRRVVLQRRQFFGDRGVEVVVGELRGAVERSAAVVPVGVFQGGKHLLRPFFGIRTQGDFQSRDPYVLRHAGFPQGFGRSESLGAPLGGEACEQAYVGACGVAFRERVSGGLGCRGWRATLRRRISPARCKRPPSLRRRPRGLRPISAARVRRPQGVSPRRHRPAGLAGPGFARSERVSPRRFRAWRSGRARRSPRGICPRRISRIRGLRRPSRRVAVARAGMPDWACLYRLPRPRRVLRGPRGRVPRGLRRSRSSPRR